MERLHLKPMSQAPKDGREIWALYRNTDCYGCHIEGTISFTALGQPNFASIFWRDYKWQADNRPRWASRYSDDYMPSDYMFEGWIEPKDVFSLIENIPTESK